MNKRTLSRATALVLAAVVLTGFAPGSSAQAVGLPGFTNVAAQAGLPG